MRVLKRLLSSGRYFLSGVPSGHCPVYGSAFDRYYMLWVIIICAKQDDLAINAVNLSA